MNAEMRAELRSLIETRYDYQNCRIRAANRLGHKADGTDQNKDTPNMTSDAIFNTVDLEQDTRDLEKAIDKTIEKAVKNIPIYKNYLKGVKGVGPTLACVLMAEFDIQKANTVSQMWQYAGLNPGLVRGKKKNSKGEIVTTDEWIRGDHPKKGFLLPYNARLRSRLLGILAPCFIKAKSPYTEYYYNMKQRLANSDKTYAEGRKWKEESKAHIDMAAKRYMVKMFLQDFYREWRTMEGLPVRCPYQEEYLNHKHHAE